MSHPSTSPFPFPAWRTARVLLIVRQTRKNDNLKMAAIFTMHPYYAYLLLFLFSLQQTVWALRQLGGAIRMCSAEEPRNRVFGH